MARMKQRLFRMCSVGVVGALGALGAPRLAAQTSGPTPADRAAAVIIFNSLDDLARKALRDGTLMHTKVEANPTQQGLTRETIQLYVLPSGRLAFPPTRAFTERDVVQFVLIHPKSAVQWVKVDACSAASFARVGGGTSPQGASAASPLSVPDAQQLSRTVQTLAFDGSSPLQLQAEPLSLSLSCADSLQVTITDTLFVRDTAGVHATFTSITSVIRTDPVMLVTLGGGYGYDFGRPTHLGLATRPTTTGGQVSTEKYLVKDNPVTGPGGAVTLGVHTCGEDPRRATSIVGPLDGGWGGRALFSAASCTLLSPTLVVPTARDHGQFAVGFPVVSAYGINFLVGASFASVDVLTPGATGGISDSTKQIAPGAAYPFPGDIPKDTRWGRAHGVGWYVALSTSVGAVTDWIRSQGSPKAVTTEGPAAAAQPISP